jgi:hypothetical protein
VVHRPIGRLAVPVPAVRPRLRRPSVSR